MNFGGPVWHASAAPYEHSPRQEAQARLARIALWGVGDITQQWEEWSGYAYHIRRRLTPREEAIIGPAIDLRGTPEAHQRLEALWDVLPKAARIAALEELEIQR